MSINCDCWYKLLSCCPCKLNVIGYVAGWFGIIWRTILVGFNSATIAHLTEDDPSLFKIFFATSLSYVLLSIVTTCVFLYGVYAERRHFMLPYITIVAFEMVIACFAVSGIVMLLFAVNSITFAIFMLCIAILLIGVHFTLWLYNILFYKDLEYDAMMAKKSRNNVSLTGINAVDGW